MFTISMVMAKTILNTIGPKILTLLSLLLGSGGCLLVGNSS